MRKPRIIFFDIDGTLIDMEKKQVTPLMLDTLHRLQANCYHRHRSLPHDGPTVGFPRCAV